MTETGNDTTSIIKRSIVGRKKDKIYQNFKIDTHKSKYYCDIDKCNKQFSIKSSTSTLKNHIISNHYDFYINKINNNISIDNTNNMEKNINIYTAYSRLFAKNSLPHSLIENKYFIDFVAAIKKNPNITITKKKLREVIIYDGTKLKTDIINNLKSSKQPITMAIDGWTNVRSNKVINLILIVNGTAFYYDSIENKETENNKEYLVSLLTSKINTLIENELNLIAITTDNETLMKSTCKELTKIFPFLLSIPCAAHLIQLCLKNICESSKFKDMINNIIILLNEFRSNKQNRIKLFNLQLKDNNKEPLKLIHPTLTRWSSIISATERILKLKTYIDKIFTYDAKFWTELNFFYDSVKEIKNYTDVIQKDDSSLYTVLECFDKMLTFYSSDTSNNFIDIVNIIKQYWLKYIDQNLMNLTKLFCFEIIKRPEKQLMQFVETWGTLYLKKNNLVDNYDDNHVQKIISSQFNRLLIRQKEFSKLEIMLIETKNEEGNDNKVYISKLVWGKLFTDCYELANIALAILSICPSEACVERSFSILSNVHTLERNKMHDDLIDAELSIKINLK